MDPYIEKIYLDLLRETTDLDITELSTMENKATSRLRVECALNKDLTRAITTDYYNCQQQQLQILNILCKLRSAWDKLTHSPIIMHRFIQHLKSYQLYNSVVKNRELPYLAQIIRALPAGTMSTENMIELFDKFLSIGSDEDITTVDTLVSTVELTAPYAAQALA
jgi:midasin (ATPase involved in ribosome maturation)